jgi:23S rRNA G2445 N2-methylase RlmL
MAGLPLYTTSFRGLGPITQRELRGRFGAAVGQVVSRRVRDWDLTSFAFAGPPAELLQLGTIEDLFYQLGAMPLSGAAADLEALRSQVQDLPLDPALALHRQLAGRREHRRTSFRVVVQARDTAWRHYRRVELQKALVEGMRRRFPRWRVAPEGADLEFWAQQADRTLVVGLRLSDRHLRHRAYKAANMPGSLRPTIAHALVLLAGVQEGQVFLDPVCGAGTLLLERARAGRHHLLIGGDLDPEALACAAANFGPRHRPRGLLRWDAACLPLPDACVDRAAANLPWGGRHGSPAELPALYAAALAQIDRVLKPGGRAVFLTSEFSLLREALRKQPGLYLAEQFRKVGVLGREADIFVVGKTPAANSQSSKSP